MIPKLTFTLLQFFAITLVHSQEQRDISLKNQFTLGVELLTSHPDSSLTIFSSIQRVYWNEPLVYWYIGSANHYLENADKACLNFFISLNLGQTTANEQLEDCNCPSWQNQWFELMKGYEVEPDTLSPITGIGLSKSKYHKSPPFMVNVNHRYIIYEDNKKREVELKQIKFYQFGYGLLFIDMDNKPIFKIYSNAKLTDWKISEKAMN